MLLSCTIGILLIFASAIIFRIEARSSAGPTDFRWSRVVIASFAIVAFKRSRGIALTLSSVTKPWIWLSDTTGKQRVAYLESRISGGSYI